MTDEELRADQQRRRRGEPSHPELSSRYVANPPEGFVRWVEENAGRTARSLNVPYFMENNAKLIAKIFHTKQPNTNISRTLYTASRYIGKYVERNPGVAAIYKELDENGSSLSDMELAILSNKLKSLCANMTFADMRNAGLIPDGMIMSKVERDFVVQSKATYYAKGQLVHIQEVRMDVIVLRDKYGHNFAYPVGTNKDNMLISPVDASETFHSLPRYLTKDMGRVSFYNIECPADKYWKIEYDSSEHKSVATDGGQTSFWAIAKGMSNKQFKEYMAHEAAHWLDTRYSPYKYSLGIDWKNAVKADIQIAKEGRGNVAMYPTKYAETNLKEDFAESMKLFLTNRRKLKEIAPNRERYLHNLTKTLVNRMHY